MDAGWIVALNAVISGLLAAATAAYVKISDSRRVDRKDAITQLEAVADRMQKQLDEETKHSREQDTKITSLMEENAKCNERAALLQGKMETFEKSMSILQHSSEQTVKNYEEMKSTRHEVRGHLGTVINMLNAIAVAGNIKIPVQPTTLTEG